MDQHFLQLLAKGTNRKQNTSILKFIDKKQYNEIKKIAGKILNEVIPLNAQQYKTLYKHKTFIRNLGRGKVSKAQLVKNYSVVSKLIQITLEHELHAKTSSSATGRVGKSEGPKLQRQETSSDSEISSTESLPSEAFSESFSESSSESASENRETEKGEWEID